MDTTAPASLFISVCFFFLLLFVLFSFWHSVKEEEDIYCSETSRHQSGPRGNVRQTFAAIGHPQRRQRHRAALGSATHTAKDVQIRNIYYIHL